jgi:spore maturation protein CgeB
LRVVMFCHSLLSCWNHGNAHFLRGVVTELQRRGHEVRVYEPRNAWSVQNLVREQGEGPMEEMRRVYPSLDPIRYDETLDLDRALDGADVVLVHEWNEPELVAAVGRRKAAGGRFQLLFHDTHHRSVTDPESMSKMRLDAYDGVLCFGEAIREVYAAHGWGRRAFTWHEAADTRVFRPLATVGHDGDVVFVGNWGDEERTAELEEFLIGPVRQVGFAATMHGVRYPPEALHRLDDAGIRFGGWVPNHAVPRVFARYRATVHVPRRPYAKALPGIPTIRVFEALACGIPLISAPWDDVEGLFRPDDFLWARNGAEMAKHLVALREDAPLRRELAARGRETVLSHHTTSHRVDELFVILGSLSPPVVAENREASA